MSKFKSNEFNLIASGCGTGKTYFVVHNLLEHFNEVLPSEVLFLTSRSMIVDQQSKSETIDKYNPNDDTFVRYWNGESVERIELIQSKGIQIMTYDKIINILVSRNNTDEETLKRIKLVIIDECHSLFSDLFIQNIEALKVWIRDCLYKNEKIFLGLTATPNIIHFYKDEWGVKINQLNKDVLVNYTAKQLHCTNLETLPYIVATNKLAGKTIIMCSSVKEAVALQDKLPNAALLVSQNNDYYKRDKAMKIIRESIVNNEVLPETFLYPIKRDAHGYGLEFEERNLEILITTSTLREGVNLKVESGVKNVICCFQDELHISQFMGRCRFNIDNLVVVDTYIRNDNYNRESYLSKSHAIFKSFMQNKTNAKWFDTIAHLIGHDCYETKRFVLGTDERTFINYINQHWLVPIGIKNELIDSYRIWKDNDKNSIVDMAITCKLYPLVKSKITFNKVMSTLISCLGYEIDTGRYTIDDKKHTYKLIVSYDEDKIEYEKPFEFIID